jgi:predicted PurR-regulated permease PerM
MSGLYDLCECLCRQLFSSSAQINNLLTNLNGQSIITNQGSIHSSASSVVDSALTFGLRSAEESGNLSSSFSNTAVIMLTMITLFILMVLHMKKQINSNQTAQENELRAYITNKPNNDDNNNPDDRKEN